MLNKAVFLITLICILCLFSFHEGHAKETKDRLDLHLTKTVFVKKYKNIKVYYEQYTIKEGDWLWSILRDKYGIPSEQRPRFLHMLKELNPTISDANVVRPGEEIMVPTKLETATERILETTSAGKVIASSSKSSSFDIKEHIVLPGQSISVILSRIYNVPAEMIYKEYIKRFCELNPAVDDPNIIGVNQKILVPVYKTFPVEGVDLAEKKEEAVPLVAANAEVRQDVPPPVEVQPEESSPVEVQPKESSPVDMAQTPPSSGRVRSTMDSAEPESTIPSSGEPDPGNIKDAVGSLFAEMGDRYNNKGDYYIPIPGGGELTLDTTSFPILEMESGKRVIMDIGDELPERVEKLIESSWKSYKFVNIRKDEAIEFILQKILSRSGYNSISKGEKPVALHEGEVSIKVWADWIVIKDRGEDRKDNIYAINTIEKSESIVPQSIKEYLQKLGVKVIDFSVTERKGQEETEKGSASGYKEDIPVLNSATNKDFIHALLGLVDQPFTAGEKLHLLKTSSPGFKMGIRADMSFKRDGRDCIISLSDISKDLVDMLAENGFRLLKMLENESPESVISKVLKFLNIEFLPSVFEINTTQEGDLHNIAISIPGILFMKGESSRTLLTKVVMDRHLNSFLRERGVKVVSY